MNSFRKDELKKFEENLVTLTANEPIILQFQVAPLDHSVQDLNSPTLFVTQSRLIFYYDDIFEVYNLNELEISTLGDNPKFTWWQVFLEGRYIYKAGFKESYDMLKGSDNVVRLVITEKGQVPKEFVLRNNETVLKNYQNWALVQLIINIQANKPFDERLGSMIRGSFAKFNSRTILAFIGVFGGYFLLKWISLAFLPDLVDNILDVIFGIVAIAMLYWLALSINRNLQIHEEVYRSYKLG